MKKIHMVEEWDYMDSKPSNTFVALEEAEIHNWCEQMNKNYSGGTTKYIRTLEKSEAHNWALNEIYKVVAHPWVTRTDGDLDSVDVDRIKNIYKMLEKSYQ
jgi:hypothetical protein